jgi:Asp-tRNA(Asn)/Glu-tRNA(Gln) amidotransferase A subunit family amidase
MLAELAAAVRSGRLDPIDLVEESLARIEASARTLNAVPLLRAEAARAEARASRRTGALAGIPLLVKDLNGCAGMVTTHGSELYVDAAPDTADDTTVGRLRAAGAIVVGRTNSPAFGHTAFTTNRVYGTTTNPWNTGRSPGGSSGGSGAALAAGLAPLATTSDGGGSVRIPASCCGLVGYKPTMGAVGRGTIPPWIGFSTQGATGHSVADVVLEASVILGPAAGDFLSFPRSGLALAPQRPARVAACRSFRADLDPVIEAAFDDALDVLARAGLPVSRVEAPSDPSVAMDWVVISAAELAHSLTPYRDRWESFEPSLAGNLFFGAAVTLEQYLTAQRARGPLTARIDGVVGTDGVLVVPTANATSWTPEGPLPTRAGTVDDDPLVAFNTMDLNMSGHPVVNVPLGHDDTGVPFGLQIIGPRGGDGLALGLAVVLERERPWAAVAPGYTPFPTP